MTDPKKYVDVTANRKARKWSRIEQLGRVLWAISYPLFRMSPRPLWGFRRAILRAFGASVGPDVQIYPTVRIAIPWNLLLCEGCAVGDRVILYSLGPIEIGARATISQYAHLCAGTHNWRDSEMPLVKSPIKIGADAWICADAFVGPGVSVEERAIVGARAVVVKDVVAGSIVGGNPARQIGSRD
jgi:putative colanic acid biosynthesis acetyltransferase WcaF